MRSNAQFVVTSVPLKRTVRQWLSLCVIVSYRKPIALPKTPIRSWLSPLSTCSRSTTIAACCAKGMPNASSSRWKMRAWENSWAILIWSWKACKTARRPRFKKQRAVNCWSAKSAEGWSERAQLPRLRSETMSLPGLQCHKSLRSRPRSREVFSMTNFQGLGQRESGLISLAWGSWQFQGRAANRNGWQLLLSLSHYQLCFPGLVFYSWWVTDYGLDGFTNQARIVGITDWSCGRSVSMCTDQLQTLRGSRFNEVGFRIWHRWLGKEPKFG